MALDSDTLKAVLAQAYGLALPQADLAALCADLGSLEPHLLRWRHLELGEVEPAFLVRDPLPGEATP